MKSIILLLILTGLFARLTALVPPEPLMLTPCTMNNGQPRPFPCEFKLLAISFVGKNGEVVGQASWGNNPKPASITLKLPKSKAENITISANAETYRYTIVIDFKRVNTPAFMPKPTPSLPGPTVGFYRVSTSVSDFGIAPADILTAVLFFNSQPALPLPAAKPLRVTFPLDLTYVFSAGQPPVLQQPVRYVQIANPITFSKFPASVNLYRDRAEAWMVFYTSVDSTK